jgi:hypothetical protein
MAYEFCMTLKKTAIISLNKINRLVVVVCMSFYHLRNFDKCLSSSLHGRIIPAALFTVTVPHALERSTYIFIFFFLRCGPRLFYSRDEGRSIVTPIQNKSYNYSSVFTFSGKKEEDKCI